MGISKFWHDLTNLTIHYPDPAVGPQGTLTLSGTPGGFRNTRFEIPAFEIVVFPHPRVHLTQVFNTDTYLLPLY